MLLVVLGRRGGGGERGQGTLGVSEGNLMDRRQLPQHQCCSRSAPFPNFQFVWYIACMVLWHTAGPCPGTFCCHNPTSCRPPLHAATSRCESPLWRRWFPWQQLAAPIASITPTSRQPIAAGSPPRYVGLWAGGRGAGYTGGAHMGGRVRRTPVAADRKDRRDGRQRGATRRYARRLVGGRPNGVWA